MKLLHLTNYYAPFGGIETYVIDLLPLLEKRGVENILIYRKQHPRTPAHVAGKIHYVPETGSPDYDRKAILDLVKREKPSLIYLHDVYDAELVEQVGDLGPAIGYVHIFYPVCPGLGKLFRRGDEICTRSYGIGCMPMIYLKQCASARHPKNIFRIMKVTANCLTAYKSLDKVIVASQFMKELLIQNRFQKEQIDIVPYFVPLPEREKIEKSIPDIEHPQILFAGRLEYEKGLHYLLNALRNIENPPTLLIAGDGSMKTQYIDLANKLGLTNRVQFIGWLSDHDLQSYYSKCILTVMPSIMPEPFGKVGVEAMANGRPVVAFNVGGIPDWLMNKYNGFLVPARDVELLSERIARLIRDIGLVTQMGLNGRQFVEENYSSDKHLDHLLGVFDQAANYS